MKKSGIELLRILAFIFILFAHINNSDIGKAFSYMQIGSIQFYILLFLETFSIFSVNCFIIISGYFLCTTQERSLTKILSLIIQLIIFNILEYFYSAWMMNEEINIRYILYNLIPCDYYIILYSVLYIISPYINIIINKTSKFNLEKMIVIFFILFSIWSSLSNYLCNYFNSTLKGFSTFGLEGDQNGYTIIHFIGMYLIGAYIRKYEVNLKPWICLIGICLLVIINYKHSIIDYINGKDVFYWNLNTPINIIFSGLMFILFNQLKINSQIINKISPCVFTGYIIQDTLLKFNFDMEYIVNSKWYSMLGYLIMIIGLIILISWTIYTVYNWLTNWFFKFIKRYIDIIDVGLQED